MRILMLAESPRPSALRDAAAALAALPLTVLAFSQPAPAARDAEVPVSAGTQITTPSAENSHDEANGGNISIAHGEARTPVAPQPEVISPDTHTALAVEKQLIASAATSPMPVAGEDLTPPPAMLVLTAVDALPAPAPAAEPYAGLDDIERLAATLAAMRDDKLSFIDRWNAIGLKCDARKEGFLGVLSASCQRIRTAQRRGEILGFAYECFQLEAIHRQQADDYLAAGMPDAATLNALRANAGILQEICSKETYANSYPAFAAMVADAEALKYFPPRRTVSAGALVATMAADVWRDGTMTTASSMFPTGAGSMTAIPAEPGWTATGSTSADFGGIPGGGAEAAPAAPQ